jgi:hypothetical protein
MTLTVVAAGLATPLLAPAPANADPTQTSHTIGLLVLKYFPVTGTAPNQQIDQSIAGTIDGIIGNGSLTDMRNHVDSVDANLKAGLSGATAYHHYNNSAATPSIWGATDLPDTEPTRVVLEEGLSKCQQSVGRSRRSIRNKSPR